MNICIVSVYFGKLPNYFPLWVKSVQKNPNINFIVYTDYTSIMCELPSNLKIKQLSLNEMRAKAEKVLGFSVSLDKPYKCCDFKPLYGLIFKDDLAEYDYWGHCDLDMIFGDLQSFFTEYKITEYDRFLTLGHLSIFKNTDIVNNRFQDKGSFVGYEEVFCSPKSYAFDEFNGISSIYLNNGYSMFKKRIFLDISPSHHRFTISTLYRFDTIPDNYKYQIFYWENGKIYHEYYSNRTFLKQEYAYIHFQKRGLLAIHFDLNECDAFYITNSGFYEKTENVSLNVVKKLNPYPGIAKEHYEALRVKIHSFLVLLRIKLHINKV